MHAGQGRLLSLAPGHKGTRAPEAGRFPKLSSANDTERPKQRRFLAHQSPENSSGSESGRQRASRPFPLRSAREPQPGVRFPFSRKKQRCRHVCTSKRKGSQCGPLPVSPHLILTSTLGGDSRPFPTDQGERSGKMKRLDPSSRIRGLRSQFWERRRLPPGLAATSDRL